MKKILATIAILTVGFQSTFALGLINKIKEVKTQAEYEMSENFLEEYCEPNAVFESREAYIEYLDYKIASGNEDVDDRENLELQLFMKTENKIW